MTVIIDFRGKEVLFEDYFVDAYKDVCGQTISPKSFPAYIELKYGFDLDDYPEKFEALSSVQIAEAVVEGIMRELRVLLGPRKKHQKDHPEDIPLSTILYDALERYQREHPNVHVEF